MTALRAILCIVAALIAIAKLREWITEPTDYDCHEDALHKQGELARRTLRK